MQTVSVSIYGHTEVLDPALEVLHVKAGNRGEREFMPLVHSHWVIRQGSYLGHSAQCARCGHVSSDIGRFCSLCGARMDDARPFE